MSWRTHIFASADAPIEDIRSLIEQALGGTFTTSTYDEPYLASGRTDIYATTGHEYEDDDLTWPDGTWVPLQSDYPHWIEVRNLDKDLDQQHTTARHIFDALKKAGRWRLLHVDNMKLLDSHDPASSTPRQAQ